MTHTRTRAVGLALLAALALVLSACGAGGFGSKEPTTVDTAIKSYVALGDGFAAGPYVGRTAADDGCLRGELNYPQQVASTLGVTDFKDVSCVGATTKALTDSFRPAGAKKDVKAQLDAVGPSTDLVTITIGISNHNLLGTLFSICVELPCGSKVPIVNFKDTLPDIGQKMTDTIRAITSKAPQAYVVVVGYPELLPLDNGCKSLPKMDDSEWYYTNQVWTQFSTAVGSAARQAGAAYVDMGKVSEGHTPCSKHPWVNGDTTVKGKALAYLPKALEQQAAAQAVVAQVNTR